jgi:hypothetical protein
MDGTGAAGPAPADEFRAVKPEMITQRVEQRHTRFGCDFVEGSVDIQFDRFSAGSDDFGNSIARSRGRRRMLIAVAGGY